jgi:hypothetical protein
LHDKALAGFIGIDVPALNGVWAADTDADPVVVEGLLEQVAERTASYGLRFRPDASALVELAERRGMVRHEDIPLMSLTSPSALVPGATPPDLTIRRLEPHEAGLHSAVLAAGFEAPVELFNEVTTPRLLQGHEVRCYLGEVDGRPVTTGIGVTTSGWTAIFNIATPPEDRRKGYGAAITVRAATDGFAEGSTWSWLQSSVQGYGVYERLGYRTVENWQSWFAATA